MSLIFGAFTLGLILSLLSLGMLISFRIIRFTDITVDGSLTLGASVSSLLIVQGFSPWLATIIAIVSGIMAGTITGILHTRFKIQMILAGILMMTALYSINLRIMGKSNIPLLNTETVSGGIERLVQYFCNGNTKVDIAGWPVTVTDLAVLWSSVLVCLITGIILHRFLLTHFGTAMRATGNNSQMVRAQGINNNTMVVVGLALSNGLVAFSGALLAQYQGFADVQMGIGMMVWGLASVIIGEALVGHRSIGLSITGAILGTIFFRLLIAIALRWGLNPNDLKLITAIFVFAALVAPQWIKSIGKSVFGGTNNA